MSRLKDQEKAGIEATSTGPASNTRSSKSKRQSATYMKDSHQQHGNVQDDHQNSLGDAREIIDALQNSLEEKDKTIQQLRRHHPERMPVFHQFSSFFRGGTPSDTILEQCQQECETLRRQLNNQKIKSAEFKTELDQASKQAIERDRKLMKMEKLVAQKEQEKQKEVGKHADNIVKLREEIKSLNDDLSEAKKVGAEIEALKKRLAVITELEQSNKELKGMLIAKEVAESKDRDVANSKKISDDMIRGSWKAMAYSIKAISNTLLTHCPEMQEMQAGLADILCTLSAMTPEHYKNLQDEDLRAFTVQHYIWRSVVSRIFGMDNSAKMHTAWAGQMGKDFCQLYRSLNAINKKDDEAKFFQWKATSSEMIEKIVGDSSNGVADIVKTELRGFSLLLPKEKRQSETALRSLSKQLQKVYTDAVKLHSIFMKSKADFEVKWMRHFTKPDQDIHFLDDWMNVAASESKVDKHSKVVFEVSPVLLKWGNADGSDHKTQSILVKFSVICN